MYFSINLPSIIYGSSLILRAIHCCLSRCKMFHTTARLEGVCQDSSLEAQPVASHPDLQSFS